MDRRIEARDWAWLALAMIVGVALRTVAIGDQALWADEALTYVLAHAPPGALASAPIDPTPPLYYWLHQWLIPDGASASVGRSISLVAGVLAIPTAFFLGRGIAGRIGARFAAGWVAVSAPLVDYSQEARAYALLVLLILLSALALLGALRQTRRRWTLAMFALTLILALYTHFVAWFWTVPALAILLLESKPGPERREAWLASGLIIVAAIPEMARVVRYATEANAFHWLEQPSLVGFVRLVIDQWFAFGAAALSAGVAVVLVGLAVSKRASLATWSRGNRAGVLILAALLLQPLALWLFGFIVSPVLMPRTMLPSLPAVGIAVALILPLAGYARAVGRAAILGAALVATLVGGTVRPKEQWSATRGVLAQTDPANDLIIACPYWKAPALMAATRALRSAPMATVAAGRIRLVERQLGAEHQWDRAYYARIFVPHHASALGMAAPPERAVQLPVRSLFVVLSECSPAERAAIAGWAGGFTIEQRWINARSADHAAIEIERWRLNRPRTVAVTTNR